VTAVTMTEHLVSWFNSHCNVALCVMPTTLQHCWGSVTKNLFGTYTNNSS